MSIFGIGNSNSPSIEIKLDQQESRKHVVVKGKNPGQKLPLYTGEDDLSGTVVIKLGKNKKYEHTGIKVDLIGHVEMLQNKQISSDFMSMGREIEPVGTLTEDKEYKFNFQRFEKEVESFNGSTAKIRYFVRVSILKNYQPKVVQEKDIAVFLPTPQVAENQEMIKLEVGIEDCLHIEFEYTKNKLHLKDCITGKVSFLLVKIKIKYMELHIIKREVTGQGQQQETHNETLVKYEVMDGCPHKGEVIPIRLYLAGVNLTPSCKNVSGKFSVKHFVNLVLVDDEDRRYFKQQEITFYRKK